MNILRKSGSGLVWMPKVRTKHCEVMYQFNAVKIWTSLIEDVRQALNNMCLEKKWKKVLFSIFKQLKLSILSAHFAFNLII